MAWWKSLLDVGGLVSGVKMGSRWRTEARKKKKARRMALLWLRRKHMDAEYDWVKHPMVSPDTLREYVNVYGDKEMEKVLKSFREAAADHQLDVLN